MALTKKKRIYRIAQVPEIAGTYSSLGGTMSSFNWDAPQGYRSVSRLGSDQTLTQTMQYSSLLRQADYVRLALSICGLFCTISGGISE